MPWYGVAVLVIASLLSLMAIGMPISFAFAFTGIGALFLASGDRVLFIVPQLAHDTLNEFVLVTIPLFIFMAEVLATARFSEDVFSALEKWLGRVRGGLGLATIGTCAGFSAVCGSSWVTAATIGKIAIPEMAKRRYSHSLSSGLVAAGGTLGILIPPSLAFILYGFMSDTSIGKLFMAGVVPGLILASAFALTIWIQATLSPHIAPLAEPSSMKVRIKSLLSVWPVLVVALTIMGTIYLGVATASEAAALGTLISLATSLAYRRLRWQGLVTALTRTLNTTGFIVLLLIGAKILSFFLADQGVPNELASLATGIASPYLLLLGIYILLTIMGMFMEGMSILVLIVPVFVPLLAAVGFDPIWFGVILTMFIELALLTPPVGVNCYIVADIARPYGISLVEVFRGIMPFALCVVAVIGLLTLFPDLALWLPQTMIQAR